MTKDKALKMAIEALPELISSAQNKYERQAEAYNGYPNMAYRYLYLKDNADNGTKALNACEEALAEQPTQEPSLIQWYNEEDEEWEDTDKKYYKHYENEGHNIRFLYTHPKQWQGLSDKELFNLSQQCDLNHILGLIDYGRTIEAKLKEKNHG